MAADLMEAGAQFKAVEQILRTADGGQRPRRLRNQRAARQALEAGTSNGSGENSPDACRQEPRDFEASYCATEEEIEQAREYETACGDPSRLPVGEYNSKPGC